MKFYTISTFILIGGFIQNVYSEEVKKIEELTVSASPIGLQSLEHCAAPFTVLDGEELRGRQDSTIGETLSNIPGITTDRFSPLASRPVIRGLGGKRVHILENGVGAMDVTTISADHATTIEPIQAEAIEIIRGPATLLYGSEATGGLINVLTNRIPEYVPEFGGSFYSSYGVNPLEKLVSMQTEGGHDKLAFHFDFTRRDARSYESKTGQIDNSFYDTLNFNFGTSYVDTWGFLGISYGHFDSLHGIPINPDDPSELPFLESEQDRIDIAGKFNNPLLPGIETAALQVGYNDYTHTEFESVGEAGTVFDNEQFDTRIELKHVKLGRFDGVIGTQFGYKNLSAVGEEAFLPKTKTENIAVFILEETDITDSVHLDIGGRFDHESNDPSNASEITNDMYSISSGLAWDVNETTEVGITIGRSQRGPTAAELFSNGPHVATGTFEIGVSTLDIETTNSLDLILNKTYENLELNLTLFTNYAEDFVFLQGQDLDGDGAIDEVNETNTGAGEFQLLQYNQDDLFMYGLEASLDINLYKGNNGRLDLNLFGDYVRAELDDEGNLARISPARFGSGLNYSYKKLSTGIDFTNVFAQKDNSSLETDTDGYSVLNMNANYNLLSGKQDLNIFLKATNIMDEDGRLHTSFIKDRAPIMGRSLMIGFQANF